MRKKKKKWRESLADSWHNAGKDVASKYHICGMLTSHTDSESSRV
jgi:hypothetical protein